MLFGLSWLRCLFDRTETRSDVITAPLALAQNT
jgi:hypothetical protein